jgi:hypothetical protein
MVTPLHPYQEVGGGRQTQALAEHWAVEAGGRTRDGGGGRRPAGATGGEPGGSGTRDPLAARAGARRQRIYIYIYILL